MVKQLCWCSTCCCVHADPLCVAALQYFVPKWPWFTTSLLSISWLSAYYWLMALVPVKRTSLSLKDNPCQRSAHQQKHDPWHKEWRLAAPEVGGGGGGWVNSRVMELRARGEESGPPARCCTLSHTSLLACALTPALREEERRVHTFLCH